MRIIVNLFSLVVVIVKSQSSQSRSHFSRSGYHRWCPFSSLNVPESSHILPATRSVPPDLQRFITQRSPRTCICSSLRAEPEQWFFRKISPTVLRKSPQLSSDPSRTPSHVFFSSPFLLTVAILHYLHGGLVNFVQRPQAWKRFAPVLWIAVSPRRLVQSLMFHGYLLNDYDRDFTVLLLGWWVL